MDSTTAQAAPSCKKMVWTGRILSTLLVLFLLFDGITKAIKEPHVIAASAQLGFTANSIMAIGIVLIICTVLYAIPRTSILGAILVTGYLGGATVTNLHAGESLLMTLMPVVFGILVWLGIFLRDASLRALIPLHR